VREIHKLRLEIGSSVCYLFGS